jgi:hypothetical protein
MVYKLIISVVSLPRFLYQLHCLLHAHVLRDEEDSRQPREIEVCTTCVLNKQITILEIK